MGGIRKAAAAGVGTGGLEENAPGQESAPKAVTGGKGRDRGPKNAEVVPILARGETAGTVLGAGRGGGLGREGKGRGEGAEAGEGGTGVKVGTEKEIGHR